MFTGLVTDIGRICSIESDSDFRIKIETGIPVTDVGIGASIACSGICLTVVELGEKWFAVDASKETSSKTTLGHWTVGRSVNLERSLRVGDQIGGHFVFGHVDGVAQITKRHPDGESLRFSIQTTWELAPFFASKGSVTLDGVALTVNEIEGNSFGVNIIPHTAKSTTFGQLTAGDQVNLEVDMLARYVARQLVGAKE